MKSAKAKNSKNLLISTKLMTHRTLVKVWNLRNDFFKNIDKKT